MADSPAYPGAPRWVKVFGMVVIIPLLVFVILHLTGVIGGGHGPGRHIRPGDAGVETPHSSVTDERAPSGLSTVVLLLHMPTVTGLANVAREADGAELGGLGGDLLHPGLGLVVLLVITVLNVYKPRGMTRYGWRKQHAPRAESQP